MKVSVVIPTRDGRRFLERCLPALGRSRLPPGVELEAVVVDNGSTDGTADLLRQFPFVKPLVFREPLGFARANNAARAVAGGEVVAFLNNDTEVDPAWLLRPLEILRGDARVAAVGSKLLFMHRFVAVRFGAGSVIEEARGGGGDGRGAPDARRRWPAADSGRRVSGSAARSLPMVPPPP